MKRLAVAFVVAGLIVGVTAGAASAQPPDAVTATVTCVDFNDGDEFDVWLPNANAVFFNTNRKAPVAATAITVERSLGVGITFTDDGFTFRGKKPAEERGFTLTSCDVQVDGFPGPFLDVGVKISPS